MKLFSFLVPVPDFRSRQLHRSSWGQLVITSWPAWPVHSNKSTLFYLTQKVWLFTQASWENSTLRLNENWLCSRGRSFKSYSSYVCGSLDEYLHSVLFFIFQVLFLYQELEEHCLDFHVLLTIQPLCDLLSCVNVFRMTSWIVSTPVQVTYVFFFTVSPFNISNSIEQKTNFNYWKLEYIWKW